MVIKIYISGISGNKEVKKRQQKVLLILDSKSIKYEVIDIAEPGAEEAKDFMQNNSTAYGCTINDPSPKHPLPPQIFNDDSYCGDYDMFDNANEIDEMEKFLKLEVKDTTDDQTSSAEIILKNGEIPKEETGDGKLVENEIKNEVPNEQEPEEKPVEDVLSKEDEESKDVNETKGPDDSGLSDDLDNGKEEEETKKELSPEKAEN